MRCDVMVIVIVMVMIMIMELSTKLIILTYLMKI